MAGRRHPAEEIAAKLAQANDLAAKGKTHREIAKALGVSVMTFHRWRKTQDEPDLAARSKHNGLQARAGTASGVASEEAGKKMELENLQLRRLVTDLLLEKLKLEEELRDRQRARFRGGR